MNAFAFSVAVFCILLDVGCSARSPPNSFIASVGGSARVALGNDQSITDDHHRPYGLTMDDYSDASFQIPTASSSNLLADDTVDFLDGVDMTMTLATPAAPTRTRPADSPLTLAELTPRSGRRSRAATPQVSLRRSPRKHRGTPAISSPLKQAVTADLSAAMEDTLSPFKRQPQEQSFQIPSIMNATTDLLLMDDGESMFGRDENATFGEGPSSVTMQGPPEPLTLSELNSPPKEPQHPPTIGSLSIPEEDDAEIAGNTPVWLDKYERPRSPSPALAPTTLSALQETVETAGHEDVAEEPRHAEVEVVPNSPPPQPVEVEEPASRGLINFPVDRMDAGILPAEPSSAVAAEEEAFPAPVPVREPSPARRISAKPQPVSSVQTASGRDHVYSPYLICACSSHF